MEWTRVICCLALFFVCSSASTIETLHEIQDLKSKTFGHEYPRHGLLLLHWLVNHISISQSEDVLLHFEPARQDYGFQYYRTFNDTSNVFPHLDYYGDQAYYCLGSLRSEAVRTKLPPYVTQDYYNALEDPKRDLDRIVLRVQRSDPRRADKVYITQQVTNEQTMIFDPEETFEINPKLLTQVQILKTPLDLLQTLESHVTGTQASNSEDPRLALPKDQLVHHLKYSDKRIQTIFEDPSLRWLLTLAGYDIDNRYNIHKKTWSCSTDDQISSDPKTLCEGHHTVKIDVKSTKYGYAKAIWSGLPKNILDSNSTIILYRSDTADGFSWFPDILDESSGVSSTFMALNHGLQPRLVTFSFANEHEFMGFRYSVIWRGPQFDEANRALPTEITGLKASLQLYTKGGYACARVYIQKSFTEWKLRLYNSWVSFYASDQDQTSNYKHYQWVTSFKKADETEEYLIYEYQSSMSIGPGAQARFLLSESRAFFHVPWVTGNVKARTIPWESENKEL